MARFHLNPHSGKVERCRALVRVCPFEEVSEHEKDAATVQSHRDEASKSPTVGLFFSRLKLSGSFDAHRYAALFEGSDLDKDEATESTFNDGRKEAFQRHFSMLSSDYQEALNLYSLENHSARINALLRREEVNTTEDERVVYPRVVSNLDKLIKQGPPRDPSEIVYHGRALQSKTELGLLLGELERAKSGDSITIPNYLSSSVSFSSARSYGGGAATVIFEISSPQGLFIDESAEEVLFARDSTFRFVGYEMRDAFFDYLAVRLVQEES